MIHLFTQTKIKSVSEIKIQNEVNLKYKLKKKLFKLKFK